MTNPKVSPMNFTKINLLGEVIYDTMRALYIPGSTQVA